MDITRNIFTGLIPFNVEVLLFSLDKSDLPDGIFTNRRRTKFNMHNDDIIMNDTDILKPRPVRNVIRNGPIKAPKLKNACEMFIY